MKKLKDIDALLFDMMGVLLFQKKDYQAGPLVDEIDTLIGRVTNDNVFKQKTLKKFCLTESNFERILAKVVNKYEPFQEIWTLLPELRKHYKLAIINNGTALTLSQFDQKLHFDKYFDLFMSSAKEGMKKPDSKIFLTTAKRLQVAPERCLFMDDSKKNIEGAKRVGMKTIFWPSKNKGYGSFIKLIGV